MFPHDPRFKFAKHKKLPTLPAMKDLPKPPLDPSTGEPMIHARHPDKIVVNRDPLVERLKEMVAPCADPALRWPGLGAV